MKLQVPCSNCDLTHIESIKGKWTILLACGVLPKTMWKKPIYSGCKESGFDLEASHLCGNAGCYNPYHIVP
jgi:hypothetical protein